MIKDKVCPNCNGRIGMANVDEMMESLLPQIPEGNFLWMCENGGIFCFMGTFTFEGIDEYLEEMKNRDG